MIERWRYEPNSGDKPMCSKATLQIGLLLTMAASANTALAQQNDLLREARAGVAALGKQWNGDVNVATQALYTPIHRNVDAEGLDLHADIRYGPHELQTFDLWVSEYGFREGGPVLIYLHGGGLVRGDKVSAATDNLIYSNVAKFMARAGGIGINANYRLVPDAVWPDGAADIRLIIEWVREHVSEYGGDPNNILLMGNSAGATHVATYLFHEESQPADGPGIIAAVLSSGAFDAGGDDAARLYYGEDTAQRQARTPLGLVDTYEGELVPVYLWSAEYDPAAIETGVAEMYAKLCRKYADCPLFTQWSGYNHVSHVMSIDTPDPTITNALIRFYHSVID
jgi:acetyl esterase